MRKFRALTGAVTIAFVLIVIGNLVIAAQDRPDQPDRKIDAANRAAVIDALLDELDSNYVFPETAKKMETRIRSLVEDGKYNGITSGIELADRLTKDLRAVSNDLHIGISFSYDPLPVRNNNAEPSAEERESRRKYMARVNYGFETVRRMDGNIGYIEFRGFFDPEGGADTVAAAMAFVANTDALIFDLRRNGGGDPAMVALICSYLFGKEKVHLNDLYWRPTNTTEEFWTLPEKVKAPRYVGKDVYVLTSSYTFSGAEEFTYNLKNLKRAKIIGETTGGGAHPGSVVRLSEHFRAFIPTGRAISPITHTNWEGTGVTPDIPVSKDLALDTAYKLALEKSLKSATEDEQKRALKQLIDQTAQKMAKAGS